MFAQPQKEHQWLHRLVGEWTYEHEACMEPHESAKKATGAESVRSLGGMWTIGEGRGEMPDGGIGLTVMTLGYDPAKKRYVGSFVGSMMTHLWLYDGALDAAGKVLTLDTEGPSFSGDGKMAKYQDVIEFIDDDYRTLTAYVFGEDGQRTKFMTAHYRRKK
jgi:hypothetical protein